jgi:hypothetical protein
MTLLARTPDPVPLLDIGSYARRGPTSAPLSRDRIELIGRTVRRTPEVMVKVLSRGGGRLKAVGAHFNYLGRDGEIPIETDDGREIEGSEAVAALLEDWDLDVAGSRRNAALGPRDDARTPKLAHKLVFSMPAGTPASQVLAAVRVFAREQFGAKHRYAMALHTDEPHPHVHLVVKAVSEEGKRLNIRKATLRAWRIEFARHLRERGVPANATGRAVRGKSNSPKKDAIYRAALRGDSRHMAARAATVRREIAQGRLLVENGHATLSATRSQIEQGWLAVASVLRAQGEEDLAWRVQNFVAEMPPLRTEKQALAWSLQSEARAPRSHEMPANLVDPRQREMDYSR